MEKFILLAGLALVILLLTMWLIKMFFSDLWYLSKVILRPFLSKKEKETSLKDYQKAFNYLLKRKSLTQNDFTEERTFFISLINKATTVEQLKQFVESISYFCEQKLNKPPKFKATEQQTNYINNYSEMAYFIMEQTKSRFDIIQQLEQINSHAEFISLIDQCFNEPSIDMVLDFAKKLQYADYKKLEILANKRKEYLAIRSGKKIREKKLRSNNKPVRKITIFSLIYTILRYIIVGYIGLIAISIFFTILLPTMDIKSNNYLLKVAITLKKAPFLPKKAKLPPYYIKNGNVYFITTK